MNKCIEISFVCKRFFYLFSNLINQYKFPWYKKINYSNEYSLIKKPPLFLNYESLKYLELDENLEYHLSRVQEFYIYSDEIDILSTNKNQLKKQRSYFNELPDYYYQAYCMCITQSMYLNFLPKMPSLKKFEIKGYFGFSYNYRKLIESIFYQNISTIKYFSIGINYNIDEDDNDFDLSFLSTIILNSISLKSIEIDFAEVMCKKEYILQFLKYYNQQQRKKPLKINIYLIERNHDFEYYKIDNNPKSQIFNNKQKLIIEDQEFLNFKLNLNFYQYKY